MADNNHEVAVFAGGCFWCTEAVFSQLKGVLMVVPGYAGGHTETPTYREVCTDSTGHAEAIRIQFDSDQIPYQRLLEVFFETHDPTTLNQQGADRGTHYRSMVLYAGDAQKEQAEAYIKELGSSGSLRNPIVTEVVPLEAFYEAEEDHKDFYKNNPDAMYCQIVIRPKVAKVRGEFAELLR
jgi:peptide-methionine (S)-S-oxide reductase